MNRYLPEYKALTYVKFKSVNFWMPTGIARNLVVNLINYPQDSYVTIAQDSQDRTAKAGQPV
jgi:hypothetical protein